MSALLLCSCEKCSESKYRDQEACLHLFVALCGIRARSCTSLHQYNTEVSYRSKPTGPSNGSTSHVGHSCTSHQPNRVSGDQKRVRRHESLCSESCRVGNPKMLQTRSEHTTSASRVLIDAAGRQTIFRCRASCDSFLRGLSGSNRSNPQALQRFGQKAGRYG